MLNFPHSILSYHAMICFLLQITPFRDYYALQSISADVTMLPLPTIPQNNLLPSVIRYYYMVYLWSLLAL